MIEIVFQIIGSVLGGLAAYFYFTDDTEKTFVCFVLSACSFFLAFRFRLKKRIAAREADETPLHE